MSWEFIILNWLQTIHSSILDKIMVFITSLGNVGLIWLVMAVILMLIPKMRKTVLYLMQQKVLWKSSLLLACLITFSRMYLYVHYPTDIIGGIVTGVVSGIMVVQLVHWIISIICNFRWTSRTLRVKKSIFDTAFIKFGNAKAYSGRTDSKFFSDITESHPIGFI